MSIYQKFFIAILLGSFLTGCNSDSSSDLFSDIDNGSSDTSTVNNSSADFRMGSGTPFVDGQAKLSISQISSKGTASVSVDIVDKQGNPYTEPVDVNFTSTCTKDQAAELTPSVQTVNGQATSTYTAKGCVNSDVITATANIGGFDLIAKATINILSADLNSILFVDAVPDYIGIIGTGAVGGLENSALTFKVVDFNNDPISNVEVGFSLNTDAGGLTLNHDSAITDEQGIVKTMVHGGTVATTVRVTAQITGTSPLIVTQSSSLIVSTGIPDQDSFSLSANGSNDVLDVSGCSDGAEVSVMARLSDAYNNPVPDGTAVHFRTEGGQIPSGCFTEDGGCTVTWFCQEPRPADGRATVTATAIGEESFHDENGNGRLDAIEFPSLDDISMDFFEDYDEDGVYSPVDKLIDFNANGEFDDADGKYNGVLCALDSEGNNDHEGCANGSESEPKSVWIRANLVIIMQ